MVLYNTLTRKKEEFKPAENTVRMYSCGPTVYNFAHIGNLRTYIFMDLLRRTLKYNGYKIKGVMNITDVGHLMSDADEGEDKMVAASKKLNRTPEEIALYYTSVFFEDLKKLNIGIPEITPKATEHITEMIEFVKGLIQKGFAYETRDGIYFDISKFPQYGVLSKADIEEQLAGARVDVNEDKKNAADFALWKKAPKEHIMQWQSPWGMGFPGWHIECSAMSRKYLGDNFDIHTGGVDHIPIHHENEIAQSCALTGQMPANFWMHGEFMLVDNGKMSKKLGNTYTLKQLEEKGYNPMAFRFFCLNAHYRKKLNFTFEAMEAAKTSYERLLAALYDHKKAQNNDESVVNKYTERFNEAINDDLNIPKALGILFTMVKENGNKAVYEAALNMDKIFGLDLFNAAAIEEKTEKTEIPPEIENLAKQRFQARKNKDFKKSDELRAIIAKAGYSVKDTKEGYEITRI
jgi:cysteinyl-tRNA synthetase